MAWRARHDRGAAERRAPGKGRPRERSRPAARHDRGPALSERPYLEGVIDNAFTGAGRGMDYRHLPRVAFTSPNVAAVGLTERRAAEAGFDVETSVLPLEYGPRAIVNRDTRGLVKMVADRRDGRLLGVHALAQNAGDTILAGVYALEFGITASQMANLRCPYLTMAESLKLAAQTFTSDVSKLSCCAA